MKKILFVTALALVGCSKKAESGAAAAGGASCADAVAKAVGAMPGGGEVSEKLKTILTARCTEDKWAADVIKCYATEATDMASMKKCRGMLPPEQQQRLMGEIRAAMMGAAGGGGGPMHGGAAPMGGGAAPMGGAPTP